MARRLDPAIGDVLKQYGFGSDACWDCHGVWVVYHRVLEQIAAKAGIQFDPPIIVEANGKDGIAAICVTGRCGDKAEWSIGEASPKNNKNAYCWAMAEKRAKDRVILKLIGLHGLAYSEEEADDFKSPPAEKGREQGRDESRDQHSGHKALSPAGQSEGADSSGRININVPERPDLIPVPKPENGQSMEQVWRAWASAYKTCLQMCADVADVNAWEKANEPPLQNLAKASPQAEQHVRDAANNVRGQLSQKPGEAA